jgi:hypothetical protein
MVSPNLHHSVVAAFICSLTTLIFCFVGYPSLAQSPKGTAGRNSADLAKELIGEWRNQVVRIKINTMNNTDSSSTMEADTSNWEARLGIHPIRTHFQADGSYYSEYLNLKDSVVRRPTGIWMIHGDSLTMEQQKPNHSILRLRVGIQRDIATFSGLIDFDGDGKEDDDYYGVQKKYH